MSAIQLSHAGPPTAPVQCMRKMRVRKIQVAKPQAAIPPRATIHRGTSAIGNHRNRCAYKPIRKIFLRAPVRCVSTHAGIEMNDARNGSAASSPIWNSLALRCRANNEYGAPEVAVTQTDPNSHDTVTSCME